MTHSKLMDEESHVSVYLSLTVLAFVVFPLIFSVHRNLFVYIPNNITSPG